MVRHGTDDGSRVGHDGGFAAVGGEYDRAVACRQRRGGTVIKENHPLVPDICTAEAMPMNAS